MFAVCMQAYNVHIRYVASGKIDKFTHQNNITSQFEDQYW